MLTDQLIEKLIAIMPDATIKDAMEYLNQNK